MIVSAHNPETDELEKSYLTTQFAAGVTTLTVKNNNKFAGDDRVLIGEMGHERSEIVTLTGIVDQDELTLLAATKFSHDVDDPVYVLKYDTIDFYSSTSQDGTYNLVDSVPLDVDNADKITRYDDSSATTATWYKLKYVHSITDEESYFSDPMQATGYPRNSVGKAIDAVVRRVHDPMYTVLTTDEYIDLCNEVNDDLLTQSHRPYVFQKTSILIDTVADQNYIELPEDLWKFDRVEFTHAIGGSTRSYSFTPISMETWDRKYNGSFWTPSDELRDVAVDEVNSRLYLGPTPRLGTSGKLELFYWRKMPEITSVSDEFITPNSLIYRYKMLAEYYQAKSESDNQFARLANTYESKYGAEIVKMQRVNRVDAGTTREMKPPFGIRKRYVL